MPVEPVDAATVILVRKPLTEPWQCFMVRRHVRSDFAADVFVFPGGKVDPADRDPALAGVVIGHPSLENAPLRVEDWRAMHVAAIRELFEEAGVLLARREDEGMLHLTGAEGERFAEYRRRLHAGELSMLELARKENLSYTADRLHPFSRWITPDFSPRRYDTWFFVAEMPDHQEPVHDRVETTQSRWISPSKALELYQKGEFPLVFATEKHLDQMDHFASIEQMIAATALADVQPVTPKMVQRGSEQFFLLPGDEGY